jgi:glycerol-3-phosphate dehydrogenase
VTDRANSPARARLDVALCGGGVAGLWLLARLRQLGYRAALIENNALGHGQTRYAQGIIHGGTKYALSGALSDSSEAIAAMPALWRDCLAGKGEIDLSAAQCLLAHQYLWSTASLSSRMAGFFASRLMRSRIAPLSANERPEIFRHADFRGQVYRLEEPVLDTASLIRALAEPHAQAIWRGQIEALHEGGLVLRLGERRRAIEARSVVLCAGAGNADLLHQAGRAAPAMQRRPLKMVMLRGAALPEGVYAHCLGASSNPRITISAHRDAQGQTVWYLGGDLAEEGVRRGDAEQIQAARSELAALLPWIDFSACEFACLSIDRAEHQQADGRRPNDLYAERKGDLITAWPTKLAFAPRLASRVIALLEQAQIRPSEPPGAAEQPRWDFPGYAPLPWQEEERWS